MKRTVSVASLGSKGCEPLESKVACPDNIDLVHVSSSSSSTKSSTRNVPLKFKFTVVRKPATSCVKGVGVGIIAALEEQKAMSSCVTRSSIGARKSQKLSRGVDERSGVSTPSFLRSCSLCKKSIASSGVDIFMYRSIQAFCSAECRYEQIFLDEKLERNEKCSSRSKSHVRPRIPACKLVA